MHAVIRTFSGAGAKKLVDLLEGRKSEIESLIRPMVGGLTPRSDAFFAIHSLAIRLLSSVPALSSQTVTDTPPSTVRTSE